MDVEVPLRARDVTGLVVRSLWDFEFVHFREIFCHITYKKDNASEGVSAISALIMIYFGRAGFFMATKMRFPFSATPKSGATFPPNMQVFLGEHVRDYRTRGYRTRDYRTRGYRTRDYRTRGYRTRDYRTRGYRTRDYRTRGYRTRDYRTRGYRTRDYRTRGYRTRD